MIKLSYLRSSMSSTYEMCSLKYLLSYNLGFDEPPNIKTVMGTQVHKVMEILAKIKLARQNGSKSFEDDVCGRILVNKYSLDKIIQKSYNFYKDAFPQHKWEDKGEFNYRQGKKTEYPFNMVNIWVNEALEFNNGEFDPRNQNIIAPENKFSYEIEDEELTGIKLTGTIDLVTREDENTLHIIDYKTGKRVNWGTGKTKEYADLEKDFQLNFYHVAARYLFPKVENMIITIFFINDGGPYTIPFGRSDISKAVDNVKQLAYNIQNKTPQKRRGFWCRFCNFSKSTFEGTNILPIINDGNKGCHFTPIGQPMCKCDQTSYVLKNRSVQCVIDNMTKSGFDSTKYQAPGEV